MDTKENIFARMKPMLSEALGIDENEITTDAKFGEDLGADSLDGIELLMAAEQEFGINTSDDDYMNTVTVGDAVDMIQRCQQEAETKEKRQREEHERKLRELAPLRQAWSEMEAKNYADYIRRTGYPYFVYDGTASVNDGSYEVFRKEKDEAVANGKFHEWLVSKVGWFVGKNADVLDLDLASDALALIVSLRCEEHFHNVYDSYGRFSQGVHYVITPDGDKKEWFLMHSVAQDINVGILSELIRSLRPDRFYATIKGKKDTSSCVGIISACDHITLDGSWAFDYTYTIAGSKKKHVNTFFIDPVLGTWKTFNGRNSLEPSGPVSTATFGKVNHMLRNLELQVRKKVLLERISFRFGIATKNVTLPLAARISRINKKCSMLIDKGDDIFTTKDGRQYEALDVLNPSISLRNQILSLLVQKENRAISLSIDDEACLFVPHDFIKYHHDNKVIFLKGAIYGDNPPRSEIIAVSLRGRKSFRASDNGWDIRRIKGNVTLGRCEKNRQCLDRLLNMMERVFSDK